MVVSLVLSWCGLINAERLAWRLGGADGVDWAEVTFHNVLADVNTVAGSLQPVELDPDVNFVSQQDWTRYRSPIVLDYIPGKPRVWRGIGERSWPGA